MGRRGGADVDLLPEEPQGRLGLRVILDLCLGHHVVSLTRTLQQQLLGKQELHDALDVVLDRLLEGLHAGKDFGVLDQERLGRVGVVKQHEHELVPEDSELLVGLLGRGRLLSE